MTIEHVKDVDAYLSEIHRVLKTDSMLYMVAINRLFPMDFHFYIPS